MELLYKTDWVETKDRFKIWWERGYFGRCAIAIFAPKDNPPDIPAPPPAASPEQLWGDLDWISRHMAYVLSRRHYGGEAFPSWNAGYAGRAALPTILGCEISLDMATGWCHPFLTDEDRIDIDKIKMSAENAEYRFAMAALRRGAREARGKCLLSLGAFGGSGDTLAAIRGTERLMFDCADRPDEVRAAEKVLMDIWVEFYDACHEIGKGVSGGSTCWFPLWAPGKFYAAQNDFSFNIGPKMFREIFLPEIERQIAFLDYSIYHLDGADAFRHLDALLEMPKLNAVQVAPGAGKPDPLWYPDVLKKVQAAGKNLHISLSPDRVETALSELSARGLFIATCVNSEKEAEELLRLVEKRSVDRG